MNTIAEESINENRGPKPQFLNKNENMYQDLEFEEMEDIRTQGNLESQRSSRPTGTADNLKVVRTNKNPKLGKLNIGNVNMSAETP